MAGKKSAANREKEGAREKKEEKTERIKMKLFDKWDSEVEVKDPGLKRYISLSPKLLPKSCGTYAKKRFYKSKAHIVERLATHLMQAGHSGRRHRLTSGHMGGAFQKALKIVERAFEIIEQKTKKNPVEVFVRALEHAAPCEEVVGYQVGGIIARLPVVISPQRRIDKALRAFAQGSYREAFNKKIKIHEALANELMLAAKGDNKSYAVREKERLEQEAAGAR